MRNKSIDLQARQIKNSFTPTFMYAGNDN